MASDNVINLDDSNFTDTVGGDRPVLVDFWAAWCGPCKMVAPVLDELADEMNEKVTVAKLNVDENQQLAAQYQVSSIPTFILFKNGEVKGRMMGAMPKSAFEKFIEQNA